MPTTIAVSVSTAPFCHLEQPEVSAAICPKERMGLIDDPELVFSELGSRFAQARW